MATSRLSYDDRSNIGTKLSDLIWRPKYYTNFPVDKDQVEDFVAELFPASVLAAGKCLQDYGVGINDSADPVVNLPDPERGVKYQINLHTERRWPNTVTSWNKRLHSNPLTLNTQHKLHADLLDWCRFYVELSEECRKHDHTCDRVVMKCSSVGQIQRVIPDLINYLDSYLVNSLKGAERRSRRPQNLSVEQDEIDAMIVAIAKGSLLPHIDDYTTRRNIPYCEWYRVDV